MDDRLSEWLPGSPLRSPAWRWLFAAYIARNPARRRSRLHRALDDGWVERARRFIAVGDGEKAESEDLVAVQDAYDIWRDEDPHRRWRLESRLLTAETLEQVASACGVPLPTAVAFHELFYCVKPMLGASDWVALNAIGCGPWNEFGGPQPGGIWKFAAYAGGPLLLDVLVAVITNAPLPAAVLGYFEGQPAYAEASFRLRFKLDVALLTARSDHEVRKALAAREQLRGLDRRATGVADARQGLVPVMEQFLQRVANPKARGRAKGGVLGAMREKIFGPTGAGKSRRRSSAYSTWKKMVAATGG